MPIDQQDLERLSRLARIEIDPATGADDAAALTRIMELIAQMNRTDTNNIEPMWNPHDQTAVLRADCVTEPDRREEFQAIAPAIENGLYLVPKVID